MTDPYASIADLYDYVGPYRDRPDVSFYVREAVAADGPVLELGCGTGRILLPAARAGAVICGLDSSASMLEICSGKIEAEPPMVRARISVEQADMRSFDLERRFATVMIPFRAFQHLVTVEDQLATLRAVRHHLVDGGRLIVDVFNPSIDSLANRRLGREFGVEPEFETPDGRRVLRRHCVAAHRKLEQVNEVELIYYVTHPDGRTERLVHAFDMRYLFRYELEHLLARGGFVVEAVFSGYDGEPYGSEYPGQLVMVARRERLTVNRDMRGEA